MPTSHLSYLLLQVTERTLQGSTEIGESASVLEKEEPEHQHASSFEEFHQVRCQGDQIEG